MDTRTELRIPARIAAFSSLGQEIKRTIISYHSENEAENDFERSLLKEIRSALHKNAWFTPENVVSALVGISTWLESEKLRNWINLYDLGKNREERIVAVIMAGNIPLVGFHDMLCVLMSGNILMAKTSSDDASLPRILMQRLIELEPGFENKIIFTERIKDPQAIIATGSDNSARYFEYYFGKYPHIIRKNRNSVAILNGQETKAELEELGKDIFMYFGLGCRNVSKLYVPKGYNFDSFFEAMAAHGKVIDHNKYASNHDYYSALLLLKKVPFLTNNFLIIKEAQELSTPVSILNYEFYDDEGSLAKMLEPHRESIQCLLSNKVELPATLMFGQSQSPGLSDYADGVDTMKFLQSLS